MRRRTTKRPKTLMTQNPRRSEWADERLSSIIGFSSCEENFQNFCFSPNYPDDIYGCSGQLGIKDVHIPNHMTERLKLYLKRSYGCGTTSHLFAPTLTSRSNDLPAWYHRTTGDGKCFFFTKTTSFEPDKGSARVHGGTSMRFTVSRNSTERRVKEQS